MEFRVRSHLLGYLNWLGVSWELGDHEQVAFAYAKLREMR